MFTKKSFHLIVIPDKHLRDNNPRQLNVVHFSDNGGQSNYFGFLASVFCSYMYVVYLVDKLKFTVHHNIFFNLDILSLLIIIFEKTNGNS